MATRLLFALSLALMSVKTGDEKEPKEKKKIVLKPLNNAKRPPLNTLRFNKAFTSKTTIKPCISKGEFIKIYQLASYNSDINIDNKKVLGKYYWAKNYVSSITELIENKPTKEEDVIVLSRSFYGDALFDRIKSEIELLLELSEFNLTPNMHSCFYEFIEKTPKKCNYSIILKSHNGQQNKEESLKKLRGFKPHVQVYKVLQMAKLILGFHTKNITHQNIMPESFVSTDAEMTDFRLINFRYSKKLGEEGLGGPKVFSTLDKFGGNYIANFYHDAHAFAVTIMYLFDESKVFENAITNHCLSKPQGSTEEVNEYLIEITFFFR